MNLDLVERIANAVLYEGYILYPYRPSAVKNQQRWNWGALCPRSYSEAQSGTEAWAMQTECLVEGDPHATLDVKVRFLHLLEREVGVPNAVSEMRVAGSDDGEIQSSISDADFSVVPSLEVNGNLFQTWQEAVERDVIMPAIKLSEAVAEAQRLTFEFQTSNGIGPLRDESSGQIAGIITRKQQTIEGAIEVRVDELTQSSSNRRSQETKTFKINVRILNLTPLEDANRKSRDEALMRSLVSTHTILGVRGGEFVSLLDPPDAFRGAAASCENTGTYPVLVGEEGARDCMLSSPIILYDYPQIAPESAGELFDGTEIDEILTLRIMTLTDEEKREMRGVDERARKILERTEMLPAEQLMKMHGAMRSLNPKEKEQSAKG
jgi:hydrogenase maturation protease